MKIRCGALAGFHENRTSWAIPLAVVLFEMLLLDPRLSQVS
jgi:hypothetical protein